MSSQENIKLVRKLFDLFNVNDLKRLNAFDELFAPNMKFHDPAVMHPKNGLSNVKELESDYIKAFPNKKTVIDNIMSAEDQVIVQWTSTGTYKGPFHGFDPNNKSFKISGISIYRIENNKIAEVWQSWDRYGLMEQIGELRLAHATF